MMVKEPSMIDGISVSIIDTDPNLYAEIRDLIARRQGPSAGGHAARVTGGGRLMDDSGAWLPPTALTHETIEQIIELAMTDGGGCSHPGPRAAESHFVVLRLHRPAEAVPEESRDGANRDGVLSKREHEILQNLLEGCSNKVIAYRLKISEATVKVHVRRILDKTGSVNRTQAVLWAKSQAYRGQSLT